MSQSIHKLGTNIKMIREAYGESQLDLAHAIGFDSAGTISMLESGQRGRNRFDVIAKIAQHYNISEGYLIYQDLARGDVILTDFISLPIDNPDRIRILFSAALPIAYSKKALNIPEFNRTIRIHREAEEQMTRSLQFQKGLCSECLEAYGQCHKKTHLPEAAANSLWWILVYGLFHCYPRFFQGLQKLEHHSISKTVFYKDWYLSDCIEESEHQLRMLKQEFQHTYEKLIHDLLTSLYKDPAGYPFAEYYYALIYLTGLSITSWRIAESRLIGSNMVSALSALGNQHAKNFVEAKIAFYTQ